MKPDKWTEDGFTFPPTEDQRCSEANCYSHNFEYSASNDQIEECFKKNPHRIQNNLNIQALTKISTSCSQSIKHICTVNSLTKYSSWISRNGVVNTYWSGSRNSSDTGCQCSIDGNCVEDSICNCDSMRPNQVDDGILTDKNSLPIKSLRYGGAYASISSVEYTLGPLVCSGKGRV